MDNGIRFGSVEWQNGMEDKIVDKLVHDKKLTDAENAFVETRCEILNTERQSQKITTMTPELYKKGLRIGYLVASGQI